MAEVRVPYGPLQKFWSESVSPFAIAQDGRLLVSPPCRSHQDLASYPVLSGITNHLYQIPSVGLSEEQQRLACCEFTACIEEACRNFLGFQQNFNQQEEHTAIKPFITSSKTLLNNYGSPYCSGTVKHNTFVMERNVLDYSACLWNAKWPHDPDDPETYWGYVLAMGATEGNIQAMWNARDYLCGCITKGDLQTKESSFATAADIVPICPQDNPNIFSPVAFYSTSAHPGVKKALHLVQVPTFYEVGQRKYPNDNPLSPGKPWPSSVPTNTDGDRLLGTVNIDMLAALVDFFSAKGHPIIVILNYGTSFEGAFDDVKSVGEAIIPILKKNSMYSYKISYKPECSNLSTTRHGFWFHVDGALGASYMPFVEMAHEKGLLQDEAPFPVFDFRLDFMSSITTSGHKWLGGTWPCGVYMTKTGLLPLPDHSTSYLKFPDVTLSGSRNGLSPLMLWAKYCTNSYDHQVEAVISCLTLARYAQEKLEETEKELALDLWVSRADLSIAVLFRRPNDEIVEKFVLCNDEVVVKGEKRQYAHIYIMPSTAKDTVDALIQDLKSKNAFICA